jgi:hypothetical protein
MIAATATAAWLRSIRHRAELWARREQPTVDEYGITEAKMVEYWTDRYERPFVPDLERADPGFE